MDKYFFIFRLAVIQSLKNYPALIGLNLFLLTCLLIFAHLWKITATKLGAAHLDPNQLLWYIALNEWILIAIPDLHKTMEEDLRSGKLAYLLPRPISYLGTVFAEGMGLLTVNLVALGLVTFVFTGWQTGGCSFDIPCIIAWIIFGALAGILGLLFQMLVGISSFWIREVSPVNWIFEKLLFALGGLLLPLSAYPFWLQKIASYTPFPAILGQRSALAIHFSSQQVIDLLTSLLFWIFLATIALLLLYRRGLKILHIDGG